MTSQINAAKLFAAFHVKGMNLSGIQKKEKKKERKNKIRL